MRKFFKKFNKSTHFCWLIGVLYRGKKIIFSIKRESRQGYANGGAVLTTSSWRVSCNPHKCAAIKAFDCVTDYLSLPLAFCRIHRLSISMNVFPEEQDSLGGVAQTDLVFSSSCSGSVFFKSSLRATRLSSWMRAFLIPLI